MDLSAKQQPGGGGGAAIVQVDQATQAEVAARQRRAAEREGRRRRRLQVRCTRHAVWFVWGHHGLTNRKIGEAKKVTKFEVNPANLSGFWREI